MDDVSVSVSVRGDVSRFNQRRAGGAEPLFLHARHRVFFRETEECRARRGRNEGQLEVDRQSEWEGEREMEGGWEV